MVMLVLLVMGATTIFVSSLNSRTVQIERDQKTAEVLAQAKEALIGFAVSVALNNSSATPRPGDLPCPDTNDNGEAESACGNAAGDTGQALRLGRLPWKTLGLPDLRDGNGERLWYAVSNNFKRNTRTAILNSDTPGTISVRTSDGNLQHDGSSTTGAVAILIAPGVVLQRADKTVPQDRSSAGLNAADNYLDIALGEDNANFVDSQTNGFIQGNIKDANGNLLVNDRILVLTQNTIMQAIQRRVAGEVVKDLNYYYSINSYYPRPAASNDPQCVGNNNNTPQCNSDPTTNRGRIPANPTPAWSTSIALRNTSNWFRDNRWREVMFYAVATACVSGTSNCNGAGYLTLNNPSGATLSNQKAVVIATGSALSDQSRANQGLKIDVSQYLEGENLTPLDDTYTKNATIPFNDIAISIP